MIVELSNKNINTHQIHFHDFSMCYLSFLFRVELHDSLYVTKKITYCSVSEIRELLLIRQTNSTKTSVLLCTLCKPTHTFIEDSLKIEWQINPKHSYLIKNETLFFFIFFSIRLTIENSALNTLSLRVKVTVDC